MRADVTHVAGSAFRTRSSPLQTARPRWRALPCGRPAVCCLPGRAVLAAACTAAAEVALLARTGLLVEYPVAHVTRVHVAFIALIYWAQPVRPKWMILCGVFYWGKQVGLLALFPGCWRNTWRGHARLWATTAMFVASVAAGPALVARVRAQYEAHLAAQAAADKAAAGKAD